MREIEKGEKEATEEDGIERLVDYYSMEYRKWIFIEGKRELKYRKAGTIQYTFAREE